MENEMNNRRAFMKAGVAGAAAAGAASAKNLPLKKVVHHLDRSGQKPAKKPLFSGAVYMDRCLSPERAITKRATSRFTPRTCWIKFKLNWKMPARPWTKYCNAACF
jgi:hypothetical protein